MKEVPQLDPVFKAGWEGNITNEGGGGMPKSTEAGRSNLSRRGNCKSSGGLVAGAGEPQRAGNPRVRDPAWQV